MAASWLKASDMVEDIFPIYRTIDDHMDNDDGVSYLDNCIGIPGHNYLPGIIGLTNLFTVPVFAA